MGRRHSFPDPNDRSSNDPALIVKSEAVLDLYNRFNEENMLYVTKKVTDWVCSQAKEKYGWDDAEAIGNQCLLKANFEKRIIDSD